MKTSILTRTSGQRSLRAGRCRKKRRSVSFLRVEVRIEEIDLKIGSKNKLVF